MTYAYPNFRTKRALREALAHGENAIYHAERMGARPIIQPVYTDHWREQPDDEPGAVYEWPDGSRYVIGLSGNWIMPAYYCGVVGKRQTWFLTPKTTET